MLACIIIIVLVATLVWLGIEAHNAPYMCDYWYALPDAVEHVDEMKIYICDDYRWSAEELEEDAY